MTLSRSYMRGECPILLPLTGQMNGKLFLLHFRRPLFAKADLVAEFELLNIDRKKMERLLHKVFESARIKIEIPDRFGKPVKPREWFLVTVDVIEKAILKLQDGSLADYYFEVKTGDLEKTNPFLNGVQEIKRK